MADKTKANEEFVLPDDDETPSPAAAAPVKASKAPKAPKSKTPAKVEPEVPTVSDTTNGKATTASKTKPVKASKTKKATKGKAKISSTKRAKKSNGERGHPVKGSLPPIDERPWRNPKTMFETMKEAGGTLGAILTALPKRFNIDQAIKVVRPLAAKKEINIKAFKTVEQATMVLIRRAVRAKILKVA
jgi:hypothetical protein